MRIDDDIPLKLEDITPDWLTRALQSSGLIASNKVISIDAQIIGEETGFLGLVARLIPEYAAPETDAPTSLILKMPTPLKNRILGQSLGVYEKEIRFYRDLQSRLNVDTPRHYFSALNAFDDPQVVLRRLTWINWLPLPLVALVALAMTAWIGLFPRRYVLLIENLGDHRMGDQYEGCSQEDVRRVLTAMADLHAQFWDSETLDQLSWIVPIEMTAKLAQLSYLQSVERYKAAFRHQLSARRMALLDWLKTHGIALTEAQGSASRTLLHGDFRLDNLCFDDEQQRILILDWQTMTTGSAGVDLAYFLSAALPLSASESDIEDLLTHYQHALAQRGVNVSRPRLKWQYDMGMLSMLHRVAPVMFQEQLDIGHARGPALIQDWVDKTFKKLDHVNFETILEDAPD